MIPSHLLPKGYDTMTCEEKQTALENAAQTRDTWAALDAKNGNSKMAYSNRELAAQFRALAASLKSPTA